jgi:hypothetical protein
VKLPAEKTDTRATQFTIFFTPNTHHEIPEFIVTVHVSVITFFFMSPRPPSVHCFSCSDVTKIVRELEADKALEDGSINKKNLKKNRIIRKFSTFSMYVFQAYINEYYFAFAWVEVNITILYKSRKKITTGDHCPISLLQTLSKLLELLILSLLQLKIELLQFLKSKLLWLLSTRFHNSSN